MGDTEVETPTPEAPAVTESKMHRLRVGDKVSYEDSSEWPPVHMEGEIKGFANPEGSYLSVDFGESGTKELTEDEVTRIA